MPALAVELRVGTALGAALAVAIPIVRAAEELAPEPLEDAAAVILTFSGEAVRDEHLLHRVRAAVGGEPAGRRVDHLEDDPLGPLEALVGVRLSDGAHEVLPDRHRAFGARE